MSQPVRLDKDDCVRLLLEAASDLLQVAMMLKRAGYDNESIAIARLSTSSSEHATKVREHLLGG